MRSSVCVHVCVCVCVYVCAHMHVRVILCACVFAMLCMKMFVNFYMFCTLVYLHILCFSLSSIVKCFGFLKALYKFHVIEKLETLPAGTRPRTAHHKSSGGDRRRKRKC